MVSILNGLSALGGSVAQFAGSVGLELQKSQLAQQSQILADQLATTRETALQKGQQTFTAGENTQNRAATAANTATVEAGANTRNAATIAGSAATNAATIAAENQRNSATIAAGLQRTQMEIDKPTETEKLFKFLGINPDGSPKGSGTSTGNAAPTPSADTLGSASTSETGSTSTPSPSGGVSGAPLPNPAVTQIGADLLNKALGRPALGSAEATRYAIAQDVNADPAFKYKTAGQKAAEVEQRVAIAEAKMTNPEVRERMAKAISSYQIAPLASFALTRPGGPETMARTMELNPDYQESRYPEVNKAMSAFGSGKQGDIVRSLNVGVQHLDVLDQAATALANGNINAINSLKNTFQQQFGAPAPTTFDGLKQIVGTEIEKAVAGGIGASGDRERLQSALDRARSPAQLQAMTDGFRGLMAGQLVGLKQQYEEATGFKGGPFAFESKLVPATVKALGQRSGDTMPSSTTATPALPPGFRIVQ